MKIMKWLVCIVGFLLLFSCSSYKLIYTNQIDQDETQIRDIVKVGDKVKVLQKDGQKATMRITKIDSLTIVGRVYFDTEKKITLKDIESIEKQEKKENKWVKRGLIFGIAVLVGLLTPIYY